MGGWGLGAALNALVMAGAAFAASPGDAPRPAAAVAVAAAPSAAAEGYRLGAGDKVRVTVFGEDTLSGQFTVSSSGAIAMPLIGDVPVVGRTVDEVVDVIRTKLTDGFVSQPRVSAEVLTYRPFYILGEVNKPGEYPYVAGLTIIKAVATAGGFTYRANTRQVFLRREADTREHRVSLTLPSVLQPGDIVRVAESLF